MSGYRSWVTDLIEWLTDKESWGTVPAWIAGVFGGLSLVLAMSLFIRDRRRSDREQIEKLAVWSEVDYALDLPYQPTRKVDVRCVLRAKNSGDGIAAIPWVVWEVSTNWAVRDMEQSSPDGSLRVWSSTPGACASELGGKVGFVPPTENVVERRTTHPVDHQRPSGGEGLATDEGASSRILWFLAIDAAGRKWKVRPGSGRPARRVRRYTVRRKKFPRDWKHPLILWVNRVRARWKAR
jgi:hypothetical protein